MQVDAEYQAHHELVERVVRRLSRELDLSCDPDDLKAWGHQGVLEAKARFDADRGVRFSTFAYYRVRGAVLDGVRKQGWLKRRAYAKLKAYEAADALGEPLAEVAAQNIGLADGGQTLAARAEQISDVLGKISAAYMLAAVGQGDEETPDTPAELFEAAETRSVVKQGLRSLPERERALVEAVYFEGVTIEEAGARLGLSKSWASRMHAKALERMRKTLALRIG
ncbi:MAG: polymerase sigma factor for flagellar operon [Myxococcaceae bacterium]|nr:polymerase sigma factor for flagellar operon [Myxococcaceae bacterium]